MRAGSGGAQFRRLRTGGRLWPAERRRAAFRARRAAVARVRSLVFQHMPLPQFYDVLKVMPANADNAIQGYRKYDAQYYVLDDDRTLPGGYLGEGVSCPDEDCGEFAALRDTDGYIGVVVGHDHRNGFVGSLNGMMLVATRPADSARTDRPRRIVRQDCSSSTSATRTARGRSC